MLGTVCAVLLNMIMRLGVRQKVVFKLDPIDDNRDAVEQFVNENGARWAARRDIIARATFGAVQALEVVTHKIENGEITR